MLGDKRLIRSIRLQNLLSFGPEAEEIELLGLNVLIGPNGSGKSNLIDAIDLLHACPVDLAKPIRAGGGVTEWLWKGSRQPSPGTAESQSDFKASIDVTVDYPAGPSPLRHALAFTETNQRFSLIEERVWQRASMPSLEAGIPSAPNQSVLSLLKDPISYPEITFLGGQYAKIRSYRGWYTGGNSVVRLPQSADLEDSFLDPDASNLAVVINRLTTDHPGMRQVLLERLREFHAPVTDFGVRFIGSTAQVVVHEQGLDHPIPAVRLSDGTLRYLCLLAILCHPDPPPLICIEEPEIGLHPDILPTVAGLLVEASHRTQLIVTTHSDALIDALTDTPEAVMVCEKSDGSTSMRRLDSKALSQWLERYSLGELWRKGELGGTRW